jgi:hypothetical protein
MVQKIFKYRCKGFVGSSLEIRYYPTSVFMPVAKTVTQSRPLATVDELKAMFKHDQVSYQRRHIPPFVLDVSFP